MPNSIHGLLQEYTPTTRTYLQEKEYRQLEDLVKAPRIIDGLMIGGTIEYPLHHPRTNDEKITLKKLVFYDTYTLAPGEKKPRNRFADAYPHPSRYVGPRPNQITSPELLPKKS